MREGAGVVSVRHGPSAGHLELEVDGVLVEMTPRQMCDLVRQATRLVGECAERSQAELERWVKAG